MPVARVVNATRLASAAAAGVLLSGSLAGCGALPEQRLDFSRTEQVRITEIVVSAGAGDVTVRTGAVSHVEIDRIVRYRGAEPGPTYRIDGTRLLIDADCGRRCHVSHDILSPEGVTVSGESGSGNVELTAVGAARITGGSGSIEVIRATGPVEVRAGSGRVTVTDPAGPVTARAGSGSIVGTGLGGGDVRAETGSGSIALSLASAASVFARASDGSVEVVVPAGGYRIRAETGSGQRRIGVPDDPAATALLDLRSGSGSITVRPR